MSLSGTPSPELEEANTLINLACAEVRRMLEPTNGYIPGANIEAGLHLLGQALNAKRHLDKANYEMVHHTLSWAKPRVSV